MAAPGRNRGALGRRGNALLAGSLFVLAALLPCPLHADEPDGPLQERARFLAAKAAMERGDGVAFMSLAAGLKEYPLYPYLLYWHLRENLAEQSTATMRAFLDGNADTPIAPLLRAEWLRHLAAQARWQEYLDFYRHSRSAELRCHYHRARLESGARAAAWPGAQKLWLAGHSQPKACDPLFAAWEEAGGLTPALRWRRIELAMAAGNTGLASHLARGLEEAQRSQVTLWRNVYSRPQLIADSDKLKADNERNRAIVLQGLTRLAAQQPDAAATLWPELALRHDFSPGQRHDAIHTIALNFALVHDVRALEWFASLPAESLDETGRAWAVRTALRSQRWRAAIAWIGTMPAAERVAGGWSYWQARAHQALGEEAEAEAIYRSLSTERSYYGFLAADRLGSDYNLSHEALSVDAGAITRLERKPALVRASELYHLTLTEDARREWDYAVSQMSHEERLAAGKLADKWQWYDRALLTLARANFFDDLAIRFPLAYSETVAREADSRSLDPAWVYAVARQESAMNSEALSPVGAMGLMQLMPGTGRAIARKLDIGLKHLNELLQPETNIRFGSYYLRQVLEQFDDNPVLATAAYNAGPERIRTWYPREKTLDADIWVDTMPFHETRQYVRRVMAYAVFYDQRLEQPITRLNQRMPAISKPSVAGRCKECGADDGEQG
ncbi:MAG TPA: transglycosylase SLT domain-containing protein [Gammaproteobacteria bacterium]|jgi:soluble lytic murein transglycosylase